MKHLMTNSDDLGAALCASPAGCAFLLVVEENGLLPEAVAEPALAVHVAAIALSQIDIWASDHESVVIAALEHGSRLRDLAQAILLQPSASWWFAPIVRDAQWSILRPGAEFSPVQLSTPASPPTSWELYAQKPEGAIYSSTNVGDTCSILTAMEHGAGDFLPESSIGRVHVQARPSARVFEVKGPQDWHQLAACYPAFDTEGGLVPDWGLVATGWDAVHLTLGGLLTAEQVQVESRAGRTELRMWDAEQTAWLRWCFEKVERLPDLAAPPPAPLGLEAATRLFFLGHPKPPTLGLVNAR